MSRASRVGSWRQWPRALPGPLGAGRPPVTFGQDGQLLQITTYLALGADLTADPSTWALTQVPANLVRYEAGVTASSGRANESDQVGPGSGSLVFDNRDGRFSRKNPNGPYFGLLTKNTPILVEVNAGSGAYRFLEQFINEFPPGFDSTATDFYVTIKTGGLLRRLQQSSAALQSPARRSILGDPDLVQYWACEDGSSARTLASMVGRKALSMIGTVTPSNWSTDTSGTAALPTLATGLTYLRGSTGMESQGASTAWTTFATYYFTSVPVTTVGDSTSYLLYLAGNQNGTLVRWMVYWNDADNTLYLEARNNAATVATVAGPVLTNAEMVNCFLTFRISVRQNGSNVDYTFGVERTTATATSFDATSGTINATTARQVDGVLAFNAKSAADVALGHIGVLSRYLDSTETTPCYGAFNGFTGETATERIVRLCSEEGVALVVQPDKVPSGAMGPQSTSSLMDNLREAEAVDGGVLYEAGWWLGWQPLSARYNLVPALRLDFTNGDLNGSPRITDDDLDFRNSWTVTRTGGSSATYTDAASVAREGVTIADSVTIPLAEDDQADQVASWLTHLGSQDDVRWVALPMRFDSAAGRLLIDSWKDMGFGQRVVVSNVPSQVAGAQDTTDVIIEGRAERVDQFTWTLTANTSNARAFDVFVLDMYPNSRMDTDGCTLLFDIDETDTQFYVQTTNSESPKWTFDPAHWPFDINIGGERMTVTAIDDGNDPQELTVLRSVNSVTKAHAAGAAVSLWAPAVLAR